MDDGSSVTAADIARVAGVGRAAVSNWRRRFDDFPAPVGGTSSNPLFSLSDVEGWLRRRGKLREIAEEERVWQQVKGSVEDLHLGHALGHVGAFLVYLDEASGAWEKLAKKPDHEMTDRLASELPSLAVGGESVSILEAQLLRTIADLAADRSAAHVFDFMYERYLEAHSRRVGTVSSHVADLMVALVDASDGTVFDPSCGLGSVLMTAAKKGAKELFGQEREDHAAQISAIRLRLHGYTSQVRAGDAIRADAFGSLQADAVICVPPFGERNWGFDELATDSRWLYGLPPRGEPELPWVQHGLYHLKPGRYMAVVMPPAAADRRSGRRIRAQLLRTGTMRAVITLPPGTAPGSLASPHLWVLRRPSAGDPVPTHVLMLDLSALPEDRLRETVLEHWRRFSDPPAADSEALVAIIDLLDEDVDLTPGRLTNTFKSAGSERSFSVLLDGVSDSVNELQRTVRNLRQLRTMQVELPRTTIGEQARAGAITILQAPKGDLIPVELPVLTVADLVEGGTPSGRTAPTGEMVVLEAGDVVVPAGGRALFARVIEKGGAVLGPGLLVLRVDRDRIDPTCLAGFLRVAWASAPSRGQTGTSRADIKRVEIPRLSLAEQQRLGAAFSRLEVLETAVRRTSDAASALIQLSIGEVAAGRLE